MGEHISSRIRRAVKRFKRFARPAMGRVRAVLKRVRGGVRHRHMEEASICAPVITARCHSREAEIKRGLPSGKLAHILSSSVARDVSARGCALSFQSQIYLLSAAYKRRRDNGFDLLRLVIGKRRDLRAHI